MPKTRHIENRMEQRSINNDFLDIVKFFGVPNNQDKIILNKKNIDTLLNQIIKTKSTLLRMRKRGGLVLVEKDNTEITTYALNA